MRPALAALLCLLAACDIPPERPADGPRVLGTEPADGEEAALLDVEVRVFFDRPLLPRDVRRGRVSVRSGARAEFLSMWFDPVGNVLTAESLSPPLEPRVTHRIVVEGLRDLDRQRMPEDETIVFRTSNEAGAPRIALAGWADVAPIFEARCAGCHGGDDPPLGLDLSSADAVERTAVGVAAVQTRVGVQGDEAWPGASAGLDGLPRIDVLGTVGRPSRSYLLYKIIGDPHASGSRMPPAPEPALTLAEQQAISRWIRAGAPTL